LVAGQSYTLRFWAKADQANRRISAAIINSTTYNAYFLQNIDLTTNWTEYSYTFTASTTANCLFNFDCGRGGIFYFDYALLAQTETILSVELLDFTAKKKGNAVHVSWTLSHNNDLKHVEIERSDDGKRFATIVQKHYRSSSQKVIQDVLEDTPPSMPTFYRLKWTDLSGATAYSKVVSVDESEQFGVQVFPNPVADELTIRTSAGEAHRICVFDSFGRKVLEQKLDTPSHLIQIPTLDWASGLYFLQIESAFAKIKTVQFLKK
jgi:hypothetical protein